jgi:hypothetical protein
MERYIFYGIFQRSKISKFSKKSRLLAVKNVYDQIQTEQLDNCVFGEIRHILDVLVYSISTEKLFLILFFYMKFRSQFSSIKII